MYTALHASRSQGCGIATADRRSVLSQLTPGIRGKADTPLDLKDVCN
jgi:hypothetical protein